MNRYTTTCSDCGGTTSRRYAQANAGRCKPCVTGEPREPKGPTRNQRIIDDGWAAYAREEGHYDVGGDR